MEPNQVDDDNNELGEFRVAKLEDTIAITTPIPASDGRVSKKTPIYHLPVYQVDMKLLDGHKVQFHCDLADLTDLIEKLKCLRNRLNLLDSK